MDRDQIKAALLDVSGENDPTLKSLKLASLCSALWAERGVELVVVGGSAIEMLTEGAYASGDLDLCHATPATLPIRMRQEIRGQLGAKGGPQVLRVASLPGYRGVKECKALVHDVADELEAKNPFDTD